MELSKKEQIAEALYTLPGTSISNNMIKYILSHIPDENGKGTNADKVAPQGPDLKFINDPKLKLHGGFGLDYENLMSLKDKITALLPEKGSEDEIKLKIGGKQIVGTSRVSMMQKLIPQLNDSEKVFMMALGLQPLGEYVLTEQRNKEMGLDELDSLNDENLSNKDRLGKFIEVLTKLKDKLPDEDEEGGELGEEDEE